MMEPVSVHLFAKGIGDAVCGYYAACGLANTGREVIFYCRHRAWFRGVSHPGVTIVEHVDMGGDYGVGIDMGGRDKGYLDQHYEATDRKLWYAKHIWEALECEPFEPSPPANVNRQPLTNPTNFGRYVIMFPYCRYGRNVERDWPALQYAWLSRLLAQKGMRVMVSDKSNDQKHIRDASTLFGSSLPQVEWKFDWTSGQTLDAILGAGVVIGNDSGMVHVAGMYGVPAVAIHSQFQAELLWSHTAIRSLMPETRCVGCRFGNRPGSQFGKLCQDFGCAALGTVKAETVFDTVMEMMA